MPKITSVKVTKREIKLPAKYANASHLIPEYLPTDVSFKLIDGYPELLVLIRNAFLYYAKTKAMYFDDIVWNPKSGPIKTVEAGMPQRDPHNDRVDDLQKQISTISIDQDKVSDLMTWSIDYKNNSEEIIMVTTKVLEGPVIYNTTCVLALLRPACTMQVKHIYLKDDYGYNSVAHAGAAVVMGRPTNKEMTNFLFELDLRPGISIKWILDAITQSIEDHIDQFIIKLNEITSDASDMDKIIVSDTPTHRVYTVPDLGIGIGGMIDHFMREKHKVSVAVVSKELRDIKFKVASDDNQAGEIAAFKKAAERVKKEWISTMKTFTV